MESQNADEPAFAPSATQSASAARAYSGKQVGKVTITGARTAPLGPVSDDKLLGKEQWLRMIERRLANGDRVGAKESLNEFLKRHPGAELPEALEGLR